MMLIYPDLMDGPVEVFPEQVVSSFEAQKWFAGEWIPNPRVPLDEESDPDAWQEHMRLLDAMQKVDMARGYSDAKIRLQSLERRISAPDVPRDEARELEGIAMDYRNQIAALAARMRSLGMVLDD